MEGNASFDLEVIMQLDFTFHRSSFRPQKEKVNYVGISLWPPIYPMADHVGDKFEIETE